MEPSEKYHVMLEELFEAKATLQGREGQKVQLPPRITRFVQNSRYFLPKKYREGFVGDLIEDLESMAIEGKSTRFMWRMIILNIIYVIYGAIRFKLDHIIEIRDSQGDK